MTKIMTRMDAVIVTSIDNGGEVMMTSREAGKMIIHRMILILSGRQASPWGSPSLGERSASSCTIFNAALTVSLSV